MQTNWDCEELCLFLIRSDVTCHQCFIKSVHYKKVFCFTEQRSHVSHGHFLLFWVFYWLTCDVFLDFSNMNMPTNCQNADVLWNVFSFFINSCMFSLLGIIPWSLIANTMLYCWRIMKANKESALLQFFHCCIHPFSKPLILWIWSLSQHLRPQARDTVDGWPVHHRAHRHTHIHT